MEHDVTVRKGGMPMNTILIPLLQVLSYALELFVWAVIISVVLSWLVAFNVINTYNRFVHMVISTLNQIVEPALRRIRQFLPVFGGLDLSPVVLILAIWFIQLVIVRLINTLAM
jgi:YggT family protein